MLSTMNEQTITSPSLLIKAQHVFARHKPILAKLEAGGIETLSLAERAILDGAPEPKPKPGAKPEVLAKAAKGAKATKGKGKGNRSKKSPAEPSASESSAQSSAAS